VRAVRRCAAVSVAVGVDALEGVIRSRNCSF
jgi:hypothetical protein